MPRRGPQVLGDGHDLGAGVVQVAQRLRHLVPGLAHAEDQVGLGHQAGARARRAAPPASARSGSPGGSGGRSAARSPRCGRTPRAPLRTAGPAGRGCRRSPAPASRPRCPGSAGGSPGWSRAYSQAPSSARSSRHTPVTVAYRSSIFCTDSATRSGSPASKSAGLPVSIWQKSQRRVHWSPPIRKVASRSSQHSKMLGQPASWHTVCRSSYFTSACSCAVLRTHPGGGLDPGRLLLDRNARVADLEAQQLASFRRDGHRLSLPGDRRLSPTAEARPQFPMYTRETDTEPGKLDG